MIKLILSVLAALPLAAQTAAHTPHVPNSYTKNGIVINGAMGAAYNSSNVVDPTLWPGIASWIGERFDWVIGSGGLDEPDSGDLHGSYPTKVYWQAYQDMAHSYPWQMYLARSIAETNGFTLESALLHAKTDMAITTSYNSEIKVFDTYETDSFQGGYRRNGVFKWSSGGGFVDVTTNNLPIGTTPITITDTLYVGYMNPYDQINFVVGTARVGGSVAYEYCSAATGTTCDTWTTISSHFSDGSSGLTTTGQVYFWPASDWKRVVVNGSQAKYWVRIVVTGASTSPIVTSMYGDDWTAASVGNNIRGWDTTDSNRINVGTELEYNPTPPANATAKFQYQSRITAFLNIHYGNPSGVSGEMRTWGRIMAGYYKAQIDNGDPFDAVFNDDATQKPVADGSMSNLDYDTVSGWFPEWQACYEDEIAVLKALYGTHFKVGTNGAIPGTNGDVQIGDAILMEAWWGAPYTYGPQPGYAAIFGYQEATASMGAPYDYALPANNPGGAQWQMQCTDAWDVSLPWAPITGQGHTYWHFHDTAQRGPMMCLTMHYIGSNENTVFMYNGTSGGTGYYASDQVALFSPYTTITAEVVEDVTDGSKTIELASASNCVAPYPLSFSQVLQIGGAEGQMVSGTLSGTTFTTSTRIYATHAIGTLARCVQARHLSIIPPPAIADVAAWGHWFPAMGVDIGLPNTSGMNAGARMVETPWKTGAEISGQADPGTTCTPGQCAPLWRRDFTKGIVLFRPWKNTMIESELDTQSVAINLGGTYYPLKADGTMSAGVTSITLRGGEGAILMNLPDGTSLKGKTKVKGKTRISQ